MNKLEDILFISNNYLKKHLDTKTLQTFFIHFLLLICVYSLLLKFDVVQVFPNNYNLYKWDVFWYDQIKENGYLYLPSQTCNLAFFPLFPYMWKLLNLSAIYMSVINVLLFTFSYCSLIKRFNVSRLQLLILLSIPSTLFFFLPYSESLFFVGGATIIAGYRSADLRIKCLGLLICGLCRSASSLFIPVLLIVETAIYLNGTGDRKKMGINIAVTVATCLLTLMMVACIQGVQTGKWFYFFTVQKFWLRHWLIPALPFTTTDPQRIMALDASAQVLGCIASYFSLKWVVNYLAFKKTAKAWTFDPALLFSVFFIAGITVLGTFFTFNIFQETSIWSINRFIFCSPFAMYFLLWFYSDYKPTVMDGFIVGILILAGIYTSKVSFYPNQLFIYLVFFGGIILAKLKDHFRFLTIPVYLFNLSLIVVFYSEFLNFRWIG